MDGWTLEITPPSTSMAVNINEHGFRYSDRIIMASTRMFQLVVVFGVWIPGVSRWFWAYFYASLGYYNRNGFIWEGVEPWKLPLITCTSMLIHACMVLLWFLTKQNLIAMIPKESDTKPEIRKPENQKPENQKWGNSRRKRRLVKKPTQLKGLCKL